MEGISMNTQKLRILLEAIELGSLSKAGESLGYTQSALTQMMRSLEDEIGFPLLNKSPRGVEPTREALILLPAMRQMLNDEQILLQEVSEIQGLHSGSIRVGSFTSTSIRWLPKVLRYFQENYPDITFDINECSQEEMLQGVIDGTLDIALMSDPETDAIDFIPILDEPVYVVFSKDHDLSAYDRVPMAELKKHPIILESFDRVTYKIFDQAGFAPDSRYYSKDVVAILSMVQEGLGIAVLPELIVDQFPGDYDYRMLDPEVYRTLGIGVRNRKACGPLARFLIRYIKETYTE